MSRDVVDEVPSSWVTALVSLEGGDITFFIFSRDHDIEVSLDFVGGIPSC